MNNKIKSHIKKIYKYILQCSLKKASEEQGLEDIVTKLEKIVPDISDQYSLFKVDNSYLRNKVRNLHGFQMSLFKDILNQYDKPVIVDIGDSSGTHLQYLKGLYSEKNIRCLSIN
jgi:hypothetical protein